MNRRFITFGYNPTVSGFEYTPFSDTWSGREFRDLGRNCWFARRMQRLFPPEIMVYFLSSHLINLLIDRRTYV